MKPISHLAPTSRTVRELFGSAVRCGFDGCTEPLYRASEQSGCRLLNVEVAHIHARSENGPRWDGGMSAEENRSVANLILMCLRHHEEIDNGPDRFPADLLRKWKSRQVREADTAAGTTLTDVEVAEVSRTSFGVEDVVDAISERLPFTARSRSRGQKLDLVFRHAQARRRRRLAAVPESRKDAVQEWMQELPPPPVVVPEGQLRVLVAPMGAGKSERAARWWQEGLEVAADDEQVDVPVWFEARTLNRAGLAAAITEELGRDPNHPVRVVIDDVTWLPVADANRLLDEARELVTVWERMRILATSRPGPQIADSERVEVAAWPADDGAALVRLIVGEDALHGLWTPEVEALLTSPLLAHALAVRLAAGRTSPTSPAQLINELATTILNRERPKDLDRSWELLARLAARVITTQTAVQAADLDMSIPQVWPLTDSGLVVADTSGLRFSLPVFEQHLGAEALRLGIVSVDEAASAAAFPLWRYPLAHMVAMSDPQSAEALMIQLARVNPGAASWVLDEATRIIGSLATPPSGSPWDAVPDQPGEQDPTLRASRWLRGSVKALLDGFDQCAPHLARHHNGRLVQWGTRIVTDPAYGARMILAEARDRVDPELVAYNLEPYDNHRPDGWNGWTSFVLPTEPFGRWRWARGRLSRELATLMRQQRLPMPHGSPLATEREWLLARHVYRIHYRRNPPAIIPIEDLSAAVEQMMAKVNRSVRCTWKSGSAQLDSDDIRWIHARLTRLDHDLKPPRPAPDRVPPRTAYNRWRAYSPDLTLMITSQVFQDALIGYQDLITTNFPRFGDALGLFSSLPVRAVGNVIIEGADPGDHDSLWYTLKSDPTGSPRAPRTDFSLTTMPQSLHSTPSAAEPLRRRRTPFHSPTEHMTSPLTGDELAATNLVYQWLTADLQALGWGTTR